jgi:hypothetical protein
LGLSLFVGSVYLFSPIYLSQMVPLLRLTYWGLDGSWPMIFHTAKVPLIVGGLGAVLYLAQRNRFKLRSLISVSLAASIGALLAYLQQHKGWHYQLICFTVFACLAVAFMCLDLSAQWISSHATDSSRGHNSLRPVILALAAFAVSFPLLAGHVHPTAYPEVQKQVLADIFARYPSKTNVSFLSAYPWDYPPILEQDKTLGTRYNYIWPLPAIVRSEDPNGYEPGKHLTPAKIQELSSMLRTEEAEDLLNWKPTIVVVDRCTLPELCDPSLQVHLGTLLEWLQVDPTFRTQWLHYTYQTSVDGLDVYVRNS